jgi:hypothetical protein
MRLTIRALIAIWFLLIFFLAMNQGFIGSSGKPPVAVGVAFAAPILLFLIAVRVLPEFRAYVLRIDPVFLVALHGWRFIGLGFIVDYSEHLLSGSFAWPAGIGDITVAVLTPWIVLSLTRDSQFLSSATFLAWNIFGIADFLIAMTTGALNQGFLPSFQPAVLGTLMGRFPFVLIPCFFVPWLFITHIILLMRRRSVLYSYRNASAGNTFAALPLG